MLSVESISYVVDYILFKASLDHARFVCEIKKWRLYMHLYIMHLSGYSTVTHLQTP